MKTIRYALFITVLLYGSLVATAYLPDETIPVDKLTGPSSNFVTVQDYNLHYLKKGSGPPLVLVHGFAGSVFTWRDLIPLLTDTYTMYALDLPGFGFSDKPADGDYSMEAQARLVTGFIQALNLQPAALVGHSMGGIIVAYASVQKPELIDKLVIIEGGFYHGGAPAFLQYLFFPFDRLMAKLFYTKDFRSRSLLPSYHNKEIVTDAVVQAYLIPGKTPGAVAALATMMRTVGPETYEGLSSAVQDPTLLVWSAENKNNPVSDGERLDKEIPTSELVVIEECGHYVQEEKPEELAAAMKAFLAR